MRKVKPVEILSRITGISTPLFGISWNPPQKDSAFAQRLISFLEDKRSLYVPYDDEYIMYVTKSILQIRERLTEFLDEIESSSGLREPIGSMRGACRDFLSATQDMHDRVEDSPMHRYEWDQETIKYFVELGKLRSILGFYIAQIAINYSIEVDEQLAAILPEVRRQRWE